MAGVDVPPERDVKDFKFQQMCRVRIFDSPSDIPSQRSQIVASSSIYGFTFLGTLNGFKVIKTSDLSKIDHEHAADRTTAVIDNFPFWTHIQLSGSVLYLALNSDDSMLAVDVTENGLSFCHIYDVKGFADKGKVFSPFQKIRLNGPILDLAWNPVQPSMIVVCIVDGSVELFEVGGSLKIVASLQSSAGASSLSWSPKGKQLVVGTADGKLVQYDQELKKKKEWVCPNTLPQGQQYEVIGLTWISTYIFMATYLPLNAEANEQPMVILVVGSKDGVPNYICYEDPCYGNGEERQKRYTFRYIQNWEMILANSSTACETSIIGKHLDNKDTFERWNLDDSARAEVPLTADYTDTFPMGIAVDFSSQFVIPTGDNTTHPPSPILLLMSTDGILAPYYMLYSHSQAASLTRPQQALTSEGARAGPVVVRSDAVSVSSSTGASFMSQKVTSPSFQFVSKPAAATQPTGSSVFGSGGMTFSFNTSGSTTPTVSRSLFGSVPVTTTASGSPAAKSLFGSLTVTSAGQSQQTSAAGSSSSTAKSLFGSLPLTTAGQSQQSSAVTTAGQPSSTGNSTSGFSTKTPSSFSFTGNSASSSTTGLSLFGKSSAESVSSSTAPQTVTGSGLGQTTQAKPAATAFSTGLPNFSLSGTASTTSSSGGMTFGGVTTTTAAGKSSTSTTAASAAGFNFSMTAGSSSLGTTSFTASVVPSGNTSGILPKPQIPSGTQGILTKPPQEPTSALQGFGTLGTTKGIPTAPIAAGATTSTFPSFSQPQNATVTVTQSSILPAPLPTGQKIVTEANSVPQPTLVSKPSLPTPSSAAVANDNVQSAGRAVKPFAVPTTASQGDVITGPENNSGNNTIDNTFSASIREEIAHFEKELKELKYRASVAQEMVGSKEKLQSLKRKSEEMNQFCEEVKTNTKEQSKEITDQKTLCLDLFAMVEECRVNKQRRTDPKCNHLLRTRALDPRSQETLRNLQQQHQMLDVGLRDVDAVLNQQWEEHQAKKKNKNRIQPPSTDSLYRAMKSNRNLVLGQKSQLSDLEKKLKQLRLYNRTSSWQQPNNSVSRDSELSTLADSLLESDSHEKSISSQKSSTASPKKQAQLREFLSRRTVPKVKSTRPENLSMSKIVSAEKLRQLLRNVESDVSSDEPSTSGPVMGRLVAVAKKKIGVKPQLPGASAMQMFPTSQNAFASQKPAFPGAGKLGVTSLGHITVENITPPSSTGYREDDEDDDDDDDDDDFGEGFGPGYETTESEAETQILHRKKAERKPEAMSSTPVSTARTSEHSAVSFTSGLNRKLFGNTTPFLQSSLEQSGGPQLGGATLQKNTLPPFPSTSVAPKNIQVKSGTAGGLSSSAGTGFNFTTDSVVKTKTTTATTSSATTGFAFGSTRISSGFNFSGNSLFGQHGKSLSSSPASNTSNPLLARALSDSADDENPKLTTSYPLNKQNDGKSSEAVETKAKLDSDKQEKTVMVSSALDQPPVNSSLPSTLQGKIQFSSVSTTQPTVTSVSSDSTILGSQLGGGSTTPSFGSLALAGQSGLSLSTASGANQFGLFGQSIKSTISTISQDSGVSAATKDTGNVESSAVTTAPSVSLSVTEATTESQATVASTNVTTGLPSQTTPTSTTATTSSIFGKPSSSAATDIPPGGGEDAVKKSGENSVLFGLLSSKTADSSSTGTRFFGQQSTASAPSSSLFGNLGLSIPSTGPSLLGQSSSSTTTTETTAVTTTTASSGGQLFGQQSTATSGTGTSLFGKPVSSVASTTSQGASSSLFGQSSALTNTLGLQPFGQQSTRIFGQPKSSFATTNSSTTGSGLFGQTGTGFGSSLQTTKAETTEENKSVFDFKPLFGSSTTTTSSTPIFGGSTATTSTGSGFGFGQTTASSTSIFGQSASTSSSPFSTSTSTNSPLGGFPKAGFGQSSFGQPVSGSPAFGQSTSSSFASGNTFGGGGGGGLFSGLGGQPSAEKAKTNVFGTPQSFGSTSDSSDTLFGNQSPSTFGSVGSQGTSGGFSGGFSQSSGGSVAASGFGVAKQQSAGFGGSAVFGSGPSFGGSTGFGSPSPPTGQFGGSPTFGGSSGFGGGASFSNPLGGGTFGSPSQESTSPGFAGFANSNSPTFGALAGSSDVPTFGAMSQGNPGFGASPGGFGSSPAGFATSPGFGSSSGANPAFSGYRS